MGLKISNNLLKKMVKEPEIKLKLSKAEALKSKTLKEKLFGE